MLSSLGRGKVSGLKRGMSLPRAMDTASQSRPGERTCGHTFEERNSSLYRADILGTEVDDVFILRIAEGVRIPA